jgi:hypothetical protein
MQDYRHLTRTAQLEEHTIASAQIETKADVLGTPGVENVDAQQEGPI